MARIIPFPPGNRPRRRSRASQLVWALPPAVFAAVLMWDGGPPSLAFDVAAPAATGRDREVARFSRCPAPASGDCVIDGDTFRYRGEKIRIADINTPEASEPQCAAEARLAERATRRMTELLNADAFTLAPVDRSHDRYGRRLAVITRGGESLGDTLVAEGLAEEWRGYRRSWCGA